MILNHPLFQHERKLLLNMGRKRRSDFLIKIAYVVLILLTLAAVMLLITFPNVPLIHTNEASFIAIPLLILQSVLNWVLLLRTLSRALSVIGRERTSVWNWEAFVLTGTNARDVLIAKWGAVVQSLWPEFLLMAVLRTLIFPVSTMLHHMHITYPSQPNPAYNFLDAAPPLPNLLLTITAIMLLTFLQPLLVAALGVLAASHRSHHAVGIARGMTAWGLIMLGTGALVGVLFFTYMQFTFSTFGSPLNSTPDIAKNQYSALESLLLSALTIADSGVLSPFGFTYFTLYVPEFYGQALTSLALQSSVFVFWTWAALRLSIWQTRRQGMT